MVGASKLFCRFWFRHWNCIILSELPNLILDIERVELKIAAGLQDRVIQTFGGVVHMDFRRLADSSVKTGLYTRLDPTTLPCLYLAYDVRAGSDSGTVHSTVRERWLAR
jgi:glucuronokinase